MWLYRSGNDGKNPIILYDYQTSRNGHHAAAYLKDFRGYVHSDGYSGYNRLEEMMLRYLSDNETMPSDEGIKTLNAYALRGYQLIHNFPLEQKPTSREEFLEAFNMAIQTYQEQ